jgi:hypothetical protein
VNTHPAPPVAPNDQPYGWPLWLMSSVAVAAASPGILILQPLASCWLTSLAWMYYDPAAPLTVSYADVQITQIDVRGEVIFQDRGALPHFCSPINGGVIRPPQILRLQRPISLAATDLITMNIQNTAAAAVRNVELHAETYRYIGGTSRGQGARG